MSTPDDLMDAAQAATSELALADMTGPQLAGWAAEHVMGWAGSSRAPSGWHPDTDWNDARRVLLAAGLKSSFVTATYFTIGSIMDDPDHTPLDLLRYVCEQHKIKG